MKKRNKIKIACEGSIDFFIFKFCQVSPVRRAFAGIAQSVEQRIRNA